MRQAKFSCRKRTPSKRAASGASSAAFAASRCGLVTAHNRLSSLLPERAAKPAFVLLVEALRYRAPISQKVPHFKPKTGGGDFLFSEPGLSRVKAVTVT
jgi:hypothetical protein